jgi:hypothetical protein
MSFMSVEVGRHPPYRFLQDYFVVGPVSDRIGESPRAGGLWGFMRKDSLVLLTFRNGTILTG